MRSEAEGSFFIGSWTAATTFLDVQSHGNAGKRRSAFPSETDARAPQAAARRHSSSGGREARGLGRRSSRRLQLCPRGRFHPPGSTPFKAEAESVRHSPRPLFAGEWKTPAVARICSSGQGESIRFSESVANDFRPNAHCMLIAGFPDIKRVFQLLDFIGAPDRIRTCDLCLRSNLG